MVSEMSYFEWLFFGFTVFILIFSFHVINAVPDPVKRKKFNTVVTLSGVVMMILIAYPLIM
jgi:heme/copper-type cytochrome/quinol oxidase subunit 1